MPKIGRNAPCPCGSGLKYKKCCLNKKEASTQIAAVPSEIVASIREADQQAPDIKSRILQLNWENEAYSELAHEFVSNVDQAVDPKLLEEAVVLWNRYANETRPVIRKSETLCAALEYWVAQAGGPQASQSGLAQKYGVSAATISKRYQEIAAFAQ
ncbi:YecA family protein [Paenibacillus turpanensis]|uniref:YecA family protein n=1 Tax=Paenibacillus turpanensis TaxID=2689078 RepID=UPI001A9CF101|nr:SEC-C metal-binding domain-containing protein [Paenibacillus turpanensis]